MENIFNICKIFWNTKCVPMLLQQCMLFILFHSREKDKVCVCMKIFLTKNSKWNCIKGTTIKSSKYARKNNYGSFVFWYARVQHVITIYRVGSVKFDGMLFKNEFFRIFLPM